VISLCQRYDFEHYPSVIGNVRLTKWRELFQSKTMSKIVLLLFSAFVLCGCTTVTQVSDKKYPPTDPTKVEVLYEQPQRPHDVIGLIDYSGSKGLLGQDPKWMVQHCKEQAAKIGADAVLLDEVAASGSFRRAHASAKAIKWK
jgi:hypothetical protein